MGVGQAAWWAISLVMQNFCFTWLSRARNSERVRAHVAASLCTNGLWFFNQYVLISSVSNSNLWLLGGSYVLMTTLGSVAGHIVLLRVER